MDDVIMVSEKPPEEGEHSKYVTLAMTALDIPPATKSSVVHQAMLKDIRLWGLVLIGFGILNVFMSGFLDFSWGILLILVGSASFVFKDAAMYVVYGIIMLWAAVSNASLGQSGWMAFSAVQLFLAIGVFRGFIRYRRAESDLATSIETPDISSPKPQNRAERFFPSLGCLFSILSLGALVIGFVGLMLFVDTQNTTAIPATHVLLLSLAMDMAVLAFAVNLASLLSRFHHTVLVILGMIASTTAIIVHLFLLFGKL